MTNLQKIQKAKELLTEVDYTEISDDQQKANILIPEIEGILELKKYIDSYDKIVRLAILDASQKKGLKNIVGNLYKTSYVASKTSQKLVIKDPELLDADYQLTTIVANEPLILEQLNSGSEVIGAEFVEKTSAPQLKVLENKK